MSITGPSAGNGLTATGERPFRVSRTGGGTCYVTPLRNTYVTPFSLLIFFGYFLLSAFFCRQHVLIFRKNQAILVHAVWDGLYKF